MKTFIFKCVLVFLIFVFFPSFYLDAKSSQKAKTVSDTIVYNAPPKFYTGSGWKPGSEIGRIRANTEVTVYEETAIGHFKNKKIWLKIKWNNGTGWIYKGAVKIHSNRTDQHGFFAKFELIKTAYAQTGESDNGIGLPSSSTSFFVFYAVVFVVTVLGMIGKVVYDEVEKVIISPNELSNKALLARCLQINKCIKAIIVAPIVFSAVIRSADFQAAGTATSIMAVLLCSFQNGFFWQTVIPTGTVSNKRSKEVETA